MGWIEQTQTVGGGDVGLAPDRVAEVGAAAGSAGHRRGHDLKKGAAHPKNQRSTSEFGLNVVRVHELAEDYNAFFPFLGTNYSRTYLWIAPDVGIVCQISSLSMLDSPPPVDFGAAGIFRRVTSFTITKPQLKFEWTGAAITFRWPVAFDEFSLESSIDLSSWKVFSASATTNYVDGTVTVNDLISGDYKFIRMRR